MPPLTSSITKPKSGTSTYVRDKLTARFEDKNKLWGTGSNDMHFINYYASGAQGDYNTAHIEPRYVFYAVGDVERYSGSFPDSISDFTDASRFYDRRQITEFGNADVTYNSYFPNSSDDKFPQKGRAMGKTRYFFTSSNGNITYPSNHVSRFSNPFKVTMYNGTQNVNPGFQQQPGQPYEDLSTASFYRVKVTGGETELRVIGKNKESLDSDDKIIRGN